jgi:hypothetical protein
MMKALSVMLSLASPLFAGSTASTGPAQAIVETTAVLLGGGCDKNCIYELRLTEVLFNKTGRKIRIGTKINVMTPSFIAIPKERFVAVIEPFGSRWQLTLAARNDEEAKLARECAPKGGIAKRVGKGGIARCITKYPDAAHPCNDSAQCVGGCFYSITPVEGLPKPGKAAEGICRIDDNPYGCLVPIQNGKTGIGICKD